MKIKTKNQNAIQHLGKCWHDSHNHSVWLLAKRKLIRFDRQRHINKKVEIILSLLRFNVIAKHLESNGNANVNFNFVKEQTQHDRINCFFLFHIRCRIRASLTYSFTSNKFIMFRRTFSHVSPCIFVVRSRHWIAQKPNLRLVIRSGNPIFIPFNYSIHYLNSD